MKPKAMHKFTCDSLIRRVARSSLPAPSTLSGQYRSPKKGTVDAQPARVPVDLNEIHRRFWEKLAGK